MRSLTYVASSGLILLLCCGAEMSSGWEHAEPMTVTLLDNRFEPDHLIFHAYHPYALTLVNRGKNLHEFTAPAFLKAATVQDRRVLANGGTDVVVQPGQTVTVTLIPKEKGEFDLTCADHDWDGMTGRISVQ